MPPKGVANQEVSRVYGPWNFFVVASAGRPYWERLKEVLYVPQRVGYRRLVHGYCDRLIQLERNPASGCPGAEITL